ncbi:TNF receptor-associated factor 4-like [Tropilaelaps mercedesae]|uniref:TNF receptor-associated factor 4-like n=1 Tax=Tropilaelaps mercedesae TaxID=418985 RepID=A0A1V9XFG7_9ACAR|nr:TNF receptor-associated factor 4-like [Tropilaelaps mercedesae]
MRRLMMNTHFRFAVSLPMIFSGSTECLLAVVFHRRAGNSSYSTAHRICRGAMEIPKNAAMVMVMCRPAFVTILDKWWSGVTRKVALAAALSAAATTTTKSHVIGGGSCCPYEPVYCESKCGMRIPRKLAEEHLRAECVNRLAACPFCGYDFAFDTLKQTTLTAATSINSRSSTSKQYRLIVGRRKPPESST